MPRGLARSGSFKKASAAAASGSPSKSSSFASNATITYNDDAAEKQRRHEKRQALHDAQMNKLITAATPRKAAGDQTLTGTPGGTPNKGVNVVGQQTPAKKVPILANFEEWMKMVTDNKVNPTNSWNFALIDYFHDMSLLKEGNGINFQKASCTLDGCVKIYTSRVDSVATETGKLLSGLADSGSKNRKGDGEGEGGENEDGDDEEGEEKKKRKRTRAEATLAKDFTSIQLKKLDLEFAVDPLFKKLAADFDEGGAKGLLLNHLNIDAGGRIVFDSGGDEKEEGAKEQEEVGEDDEDAPAESTMLLDDEVKVKEENQDEMDLDVFVDVQAIGAKFIPDLTLLDEQDICPSLKNFELDDPSSTLDIPFLKAMTEKEEEELAAAQDNMQNYDDDDDFGGGGFDVAVPGMGDESMAFGTGGEVWAQNLPGAENLLMTPGKANGLRMAEDPNFDVNSSDFVVRLGGGKEVEEEDILAYFDEALRKNWAGPEHWRITRIKEGASKAKEPAPRTRKEKIPFTINFYEPDLETDDINVLFARSNASINLPRTQWRMANRNLLPDDKHFNSKQLRRLFLKPRAMLQSRKLTRGRLFAQELEGRDGSNEGMEEQFWAQNEIAVTSTPERPAGTYDADFFHDNDLPMGHDMPDDDDDDAFADAREMFTPDVAEVDANGNAVNGADGMNKLLGFGSQLVTSSRARRPEYVQYARVAKKVDVRKLKENMWAGLQFESIDLQPPPAPKTPGRAAQQPTPAPEKSTPAPPEFPRKFTEVINGLRMFYPNKAMADISTSYCFISLLHLANEKGLIIRGDGTLKQLDIIRDMEAEVGGEY